MDRPGFGRLIKPGPRPFPTPARPVDRAWPALPLAALGLAVIVALVGVIAAPQPSETDRITQAVQDFALAAQERRGEDACALLTPRARQNVAARTGTLDCATTIRSFGFGIDAAALRAARIAGVKVVGSRATIAPEQLRQPDGSPFGRGLALERTGDEWRIAELT